MEIKFHLLELMNKKNVLKIKKKVEIIEPY